MMLFGNKSSVRRAAIREKWGSASRPAWRKFQNRDLFPSLVIAGGFWLAITAILLLRQQVVPYWLHQYIPHNIVARVDFNYQDPVRMEWRKREVASAVLPVYRQSPDDPWSRLQSELTALPDRVYDTRSSELPADLKGVLDSASLTALEQDRTGPRRAAYEQSVRQFVDDLRSRLTDGGAPLTILAAAERQSELNGKSGTITLRDSSGNQRDVDVQTQTISTSPPPEFTAKIEGYADLLFELPLQPKIAALAAAILAEKPTHVLDLAATAQARTLAADHVPASEATEHFVEGEVIAQRGQSVNDSIWQILRAENQQYIQELDSTGMKSRAAYALMALLVTISLGAYIARFQPRIVRNHARGFALAALIVLMLLISELAAMGSNSLYIFGIAPTILTAIILAIAYDQRFALGFGMLDAILVTFALNQTVMFLIVLWVGLVTVGFMLDEIRTRSKLVEVGGVAALAMAIATAAGDAINLYPPRYVGVDCLHAAAAGLIAAFFVLGILPFIEKAFGITTSMTLLELADNRQPLLRRLSEEAPGTYSHSIQVANLAEEAAEAVGANALACRVGSYYHDIGKINKADYFIENQHGGPNRHLNVSPSVSLLIIIGHVKDGVELAREYNLPRSLIPFIQQHHGTTLVEFFFDQAQRGRDEDQPQISEMQYRYPGPKPKTRETALVMLADCVESAARCLHDPTAARIEALVHDLALKRLLDGQFDDCDLTMRDLARAEDAMLKTLLGLYHSRIPYPSNQPANDSSVAAAATPDPQNPAARSA